MGVSSWSTGAKASVAAGMVTIAGLVAYGVLSAGTAQMQVRRNATEVVIAGQVDGGPMPTGDIVCAHQTGYAYAPALALFGLDAGGRPGAYATVDICWPRQDAGLAEPDLPGGMVALETTQVETSYDGGPMFYAGLASTVGPCACSSGSACQAPQDDGGWGAARVGLTHQPGAFDGGGCLMKACVELAGISSWPAGCPALQ